MRFLDLYISGFGKFHDTAVSFEDGLNVIYGKNDVVSGGAPPLTLDAEEHAADKGVDRGFAGFIFTVNDV